MTLGTSSPATVEEMLDKDSNHEFEISTKMKPFLAGADASSFSNSDC
jgi:hypothetical protein